MQNRQIKLQGLDIWIVVNAEVRRDAEIEVSSRKCSEIKIIAYKDPQKLRIEVDNVTLIKQHVIKTLHRMVATVRTHAVQFNVKISYSLVSTKDGQIMGNSINHSTWSS